MEHKSLVNVDGFFYIIGSIPMFIVSIVLILANFIMYLAKTMSGIGLVINLGMYIIPTLFLPSITAIIAMFLDKKPIKHMIKGLLAYPLFMGSWLAINFKCLFKRETSWEKINHVRNIKIADVNNFEEKVI